MSGVESLVARLRLDADLGVDFLPGGREECLRAIDALAKRTAQTQAKQPAAAVPAAPVVPVVNAAVAAKPLSEKPLSEGGVETPAGYVSLVPFAPGPENPEKEALLADLRRESATCTLCPLCRGRKHVVWGEGNLDTDVLFIGEGPGRDEDIEGRPFVGRSGRLLTDIIEKGMKRPRSSVYIANVVKCRPPGNRDPEGGEVEACSVYLRKQIAVIRPAVIVAVGMVAGRALLGLPPGTSGLRGKWREHEGIPLRVIYHPSFLLRQRQAEEGRRTAADRTTWEDIQEVMRKAAEPRG